MGNLSNLYISQSFQSLIHLGTNNTASAALIELQDGYGNNIGVAVNTAGDLFLSGSLTASLQNGYVWVGAANGKTTTVATSSFGGGSTIPAGTISSSAQITSLGFVSSSVTASSLITASVSGQTMTFTKGNGTTFNVTLPAGSGSIIDTGSFATTGSNSFNGNQDITGSLSIAPNHNINIGNAADSSGRTQLSQFANRFGIQAFTGSAANPAKMVLFDIESVDLTANGVGVGATFTASLQQGYVWVGDASGRTTTVATSSFAGGGTIPTGTISGSAQITALGFVSSSITASSLVTASFSGNTLTFTKGDASTFGILIPDVSGSTINTGSFATTASFNAYTSSNDQKVNSLIAATGSYATTGSNVFTGSQTFADSGSNRMILHSISGSLVYTNSDIDNFLNVSGAINTTNTNAKLGGNLLFKTQNNQSGSLTISGSGNLVMAMPTIFTGFKSQLTSQNLAFTQPALSASMAFPVNINTNIFQTAPTLRGPVSSSTWTIASNYFGNSVSLGTSAANHFEKAIAGVSLQNNNINGTVSAVANTTNFNTAFSIANSNINQGLTINAISSSVQIGNSNMGGLSATINNRASSSLATNTNNFLIISSVLTSGQTTVINADGASATNVSPGVVASILGGTAANIQVGTPGVSSDSNQLRNNIVFGQNLNVTGSNSAANGNSSGGAFLGRCNSTTSRQNDSSYVVFAVGTGTNTTTGRKTGFLIDSGSNTFVEGTLNVSGSTSLTGSLTATGTFTASLANGFTYVGNSSNISTLVATSSFAGGGVPAGTVSSSAQITAFGFATTGSNSFNGTQRITGSLIVSGSNTTFTSSVSIRGNTTFTTVDGITNCIILGDSAMANAVGNTTNIAIGGSAMRYASGSQQNVALGQNALLITSGSNNFAIGNYAMESNTTGNENTAIGTGALNKNLAGGRNVGIGSGTLFFNENGQNNIAIGYSAGNYVSESNNVHIGYQAGANMSGSRNVILGGYTGVGESGNDNIIFATGDGTLKARYNSGWAFKDKVDVSGSLKVASTFELNLPTGSNQQAGTAVLDGGNPGTVTVSNSKVTANSIILLTKQTLAHTNGYVAVSSKGAGTFTIESNHNGDTDTVGWFIINNS